jgi:hypothetical protein
MSGYNMSVTEKDIRKVLLKHPWLPHEIAQRIAEDLKRKTTNTTNGLRAYNREYMRLRRAEKRGEDLSDVAGIVSGKYLKKQRKS